MSRRIDAWYSVALLVLTMATGAIDAVSFIALDRVFTGNMTGNVLFIGIGLAGVTDIPALNNLVALVAFMTGAVVCARALGRAESVTGIPKSSLVVLIVGTALTITAAVVWIFLGEITEAVMLVFTAALAVILGAQAAAVKPVGIRDLSTVVVTMTMVHLSTDSRIAGGKPAGWQRRIGAILAMGLGALIAALLALRVSGAWALVSAASMMLIGVSLLVVTRRIELRAAKGVSAMT